MQIVTYKIKADELNIQTHDVASSRLGFMQDDWVVDAVFAQQWLIQEQQEVFPHLLPTDLLTLLERGRNEFRILESVVHKVAQFDVSKCKVEGEGIALELDELLILPPLPVPVSFRDFYGFEQHVKTCREKRGLDMIPEWYELPVFYFSNHRAMVGMDHKIKKPDYTSCLDFELEVACVIGKRGKNIAVEDARDHIAGLMILNDWSARDIQRKEMAVGLGPSKGKDFATSMGPYFVPLFALEDRRRGDHWDLKMAARINGKQVSKGNLRDLTWTFSAMVAHASQDCELVPGEVFGSGTVGTGCLLELGIEVHRYLEPGDIIELEVERLGVLSNRISRN
ncbi:fumarylacetoacetate hydrolase family protein [Thermoactinomyces sp. DSM 45892]|uniref:fumarylacetoacetate hydrolase family protein n=1 Tax=Thermoactinomyces sp. DSM 45892 TaxID=1882753 RepID=UPI000894E0A4|nr:fumarylacetoacetate hydrolase family protein [Thermoactinomyces sp. DSM 45892]SDY26052.1 fumarylacetoacetate (FAA) hydrolase [Thermoactinomyces sp. DSM 45892]